MKLSDFDFDLPEALIAQEALPNRTDARLLILDRESGKISHKYFRDLPDLLRPDDLLVLNNSRVLSARFFAKKETGGIVEVLLLHQCHPEAKPKDLRPEILRGVYPEMQILHSVQDDSRRVQNDKSGQTWEALLKPSGRVKSGQKIWFQRKENSSTFSAEVMDSSRENSGVRLLQFEPGINMHFEMEHSGHVPLPPYINREDLPIDKELYQTVYAKRSGSVASPTAGLHFDEALLDKIEKRGIEIAYVILHVSYGTFQPVTVDDLTKHHMHPEYFDIPEETAEKINIAKTAGRRIIACGTTSVRTLESASVDMLPPEITPKNGMTNIFIYPPYEFKITDAIITNFHLPRTTLLMLIAAFCGKENLDQAYQEAIKEGYRFYSYGDAMLVI